jgi:hypothetical protein
MIFYLFFGRKSWMDESDWFIRSMIRRILPKLLLAILVFQLVRQFLFLSRGSPICSALFLKLTSKNDTFPFCITACSNLLTSTSEMLLIFNVITDIIIHGNSLLVAWLTRLTYNPKRVSARVRSRPELWISCEYKEGLSDETKNRCPLL